MELTAHCMLQLLQQLSKQPGLNIFTPAIPDLLNANSFGDDVFDPVLRWLLHQVAVQQAGEVTVQALKHTSAYSMCWDKNRENPPLQGFMSKL